MVSLIEGLNFFKNRNGKLGIWIFLSILFVLAAVLSVGLTFRHYNENLIGLSSDDIQLMVFWQDIKEHGLSVIPDWQFPSDNFYLTSLPMQILVSTILGINVTSVIISGWMFYFVNAVCLGLAVARVSEPLIGLATSVIALSLSDFSIGVGWLNLPVVHNSSWMFALIGLNLVLWRVPRWFWSSLLFLVVFMGTISDPWFDAAFPTLQVPSISQSSEYYFSRKGRKS